MEFKSHVFKLIMGCNSGLKFAIGLLQKLKIFLPLNYSTPKSFLPKKLSAGNKIIVLKILYFSLMNKVKSCQNIMTNQKDGSGASLSQNSKPLFFFKSGRLLIICTSKMGAAKANSLCKNFNVSPLSGQFQRNLEPAVLCQQVNLSPRWQFLWESHV